MKKFFSMLLATLIILSAAVMAEASKFGDNYRLEKILILSRHNIRTPHIDTAKELTAQKWVNWSAPSRELTLRGGLVETELGQYFRKYLIDENFMPENYQPAEGEFRFYANARQRTVATAQYFSGGLLPVANARIEFKPPLETRDIVFNTRLTFVNDKFSADFDSQVAKYFGEKNFSGDFAVIEKVLDFKNSPYAKKTGDKNFRVTETKLPLKVGKQPNVSGLTFAAVEAADSLVLQYYETGTAFGKKLSDKQWKAIGVVNGIPTDIVALPAAALNIAQPTIVFMNDELNNAARKFSFMCGHDTNLAAVMTALGVEDYILSDTIETRTPIGSKVVVEKWRGSDGQIYATLNLVYPTVKQLRNIETLTLDNPPKILPLRLKGLQANSDGLYLFDDVLKRFAEVLAEYDAQKNF